jgi:hypothetical protein
VQGESKFNNTKHRRKTKNGKQKPKDKSAHYQPSNKVTNRHYSFGPAKISTFPGSDIRYQISDITCISGKEQGGNSSKPYLSSEARLPYENNSLLFIFVSNIY